MATIKVLIVDDSAVVRQVLSSALAQDPSIDVYATASDPIFAMEKMKTQWPDVIVLDVEMPRMDGISFLKKIMAERPTPVVICSTLTEKGAATTMEAMAAGAVTIVTKPKMALKQFLIDAADELISSVKAASQARVSRLRNTVAPVVNAAPAAHTEGRSSAMAQTTDFVVAIGTSTGGTQALELVLKALPRVCPGIVIVQHMPEKFTGAFAERLNGLCQIEVKEAATGDRVIPGRAIIAPGGRHMQLKRNGAQYHVEVIDGPPVNRHRPSVDVLFRSVAKFAGRNALGIIMTGMGGDGALGLKEMHDAGANTIAQDEASCVVFGMPKEAIKLGAADRVIPLNAIPNSIIGGK
ncbi:chemotaxis response regulator protein-glutamate methylesterase [Leeia sp. TBRC 13508]|uniref:Protein-glutamate methylesterase/protein-glutamine glutaminase n=1 Tax=Leeia speluncae TaxID=2884804 RepID=A0ABS8D714_9NEIS|nr:chemotaxis response regulator protein-glutamate methylesterase [Leeia speluncae]MCB6183966.1 chemotaxis response regulator protein-glutamate methylesterase [Leeia speluncae]